MRTCLYAVLIGAVILAVAARGEPPAQDHKQFSGIELFPSDAIKWKEGPPSLPKGAMIAVLEGDPAKEGPFVFRVKIPDGYRVPPHTHPKTECVTVISGTFNIGMGDKFDEKATRAMPAGTYGYWEGGMKHFVWAKGETVLQFHGMGPWSIKYVNPKDDPRTSGPQEGAKEPTLIAKPDAFKPLLSPDCSHCKTENIRRKDDLRADDRVLCFRQVFNDGYTNDGAIPIRFFLNAHRVLSDSWGVFVYDPDAGYARGFRPEGRYTFYGWRNGVMVMKGDDGTLYSCLTGIAFQGPKKGTRLEPRATLVSDWGFWHHRYPQAMAFTMFEKYKPVELPTELNEASVKSRGPADKRLSADTPILGVWDGKQARAYPLDVLKKSGVVHEPGRVVLWYEPTRTAAAYRLPTFGDWSFSTYAKVEAAPFVDKRTGGRWDITGRGIAGGPVLPWLDGIEVKWFAWAAEYPETSIYGMDSPKPDKR